MTWLNLANTLLNTSMGGTFAERPDFSGISAILDLGSGPGGWVLEVAREHPQIEVTGIDISEAMIRFAKAQAISRGYGNASFQVMNVKGPLGFADASFDLVNARKLFGVLSPGEWPQLLAECKRILRPGGIIRLTELEAPVTTSPALSWLWQQAALALFRNGRSFSPDGRTIGIIAVLKRLLRDAGFQDIRRQVFDIDLAEQREGFDRDFAYAFTQLCPFIVGSGITTEEEYNRYFRQMLSEVKASNFEGTWFYVSFSGRGSC